MRFQRLVRDLSKELNKDIEFIIEGGDIELDKNKKDLSYMEEKTLSLNENF